MKKPFRRLVGETLPMPTQGVSISGLPSVSALETTKLEILALEGASGTHSISLEQLRLFLFEDLVGTIQTFAFENVPENYLLCDGRAVSISDYSKLYAKIGTIYGDNSADATQFFLPDLQGLFIRGWDPQNKRDPDKRALGSEQQDALQQHTHKYQAMDDNGDSTEHDQHRYNLKEDRITSGVQGARVAVETRAKNRALVFAIRAF